jgi:hypothetical protein
MFLLLIFFRGCLSLSSLVQSPSNLFSTPTFSQIQFDFRVASRLLSGFDLCIVSPSPVSVVEDVSLLFVPFKDPQVLGDCWRNQAEYRDLQGAWRLGFDVGMKEDPGLFSVQRKESEGQIFSLLLE